MANPVTLVTFLLDKSGSMESIRGDTIGAWNTYLDTLKAEKDASILFTFLQFDTTAVEKLCVNEPVANVQPLTYATFVPRGGTPLIDAAYTTIKAVESALTKRDDKPKVIVCIQTDGEENSSVDHDMNELHALIKEKTAEGWQFIFMGASVDAYAQAQKYGISVGNTVSYDAQDIHATRAAFTASASNSAAFASGRASDTQYSLHQRSRFGDKHYDRYVGGKPHVAPQPASTPVGMGPKVKSNAPKARKSVVDRIDL